MENLNKTNNIGVTKCSGKFRLRCLHCENALWTGDASPHGFKKQKQTWRRFSVQQDGDGTSPTVFRPLTSVGPTGSELFSVIYEKVVYFLQREGG